MAVSFFVAEINRLQGRPADDSTPEVCIGTGLSEKSR